jgi:hypothetical protein
VVRLGKNRHNAAALLQKNTCNGKRAASKVSAHLETSKAAPQVVNNP